MCTPSPAHLTLLLRPCERRPIARRSRPCLCSNTRCCTRVNVCLLAVCSLHRRVRHGCCLRTSQVYEMLPARSTHLRKVQPRKADSRYLLCLHHPSTRLPFEVQQWLRPACKCAENVKNALTRLQVRKEGRNFGRFFWSCAKCSFFKFEDA